MDGIQECVCDGTGGRDAENETCTSAALVFVRVNGMLCKKAGGDQVVAAAAGGP